MTSMIFYSGTRNASSWALRAWMALHLADVDFREHEIDLRRPARYLALAAVGRISPAACVPVLVVGSSVIFDSLAIMEYANECANGRLLPRDPLARARARSLLAWQHSGLSNIASRISFESAFYRHKRSLSEGEIAEADRLFALLDSTLEGSGGPYLFGGISLADCTMVPTIIRLYRHGPPRNRWPRCDAWACLLQSQPLVLEWLASAESLPPIWHDSYLIPGAQASWQAAGGAACSTGMPAAPVAD